MLNKRVLKKFAAAGFIIAGIILSAAAKADAASGVQANVPLDFNGDGRTDYAVVRPPAGTGGTGQLQWYYSFSSAPGSANSINWGIAGDYFVPADYDGDNKTDIAVWRPGETQTVSGVFYILNSLTNTLRAENFGRQGDNPRVVGDYDGDGKADLAVYREATTTNGQSFWFYRGSLEHTGNGFRQVNWGGQGDKPYVGDFDADGRLDFTVRRLFFGNNTIFWTHYSSGANHTKTPYGLTTDVMAPGDYDGDGRTDLAIVRIFNSQRQWWIRNSSTGNSSNPIFGVPGDLPVPGDYDGDGLTDVAVWRPSSTTNGNSRFWVSNSSNGQVLQLSYGLQNDFPLANYAY